jgi:imidazolonepropionase-like amidohydrolase
MKDFVGRFHRAGGIVITGTDCTPQCGYGIQDELRLLVDAGLTPAAALRAATSDAARVLGWADSVGVVKAGYVADLVILEADPLRDIANAGRVRAVVANGRFLDVAASRVPGFPH